MFVRFVYGNPEAMPHGSL